MKKVISLVQNLLLLYVMFSILKIVPTSAVNMYMSVGAVMFVDPASIVDPELIPSNNFTIFINITEANNLYTWQISLMFDPTIMECTNASYPPSHVFDEKPFVSVEPAINNTGGRVLHGCSLIGDNSVDVERGVLCAFDFHILDTGSCSLALDERFSFLLDSNLSEIPITLEDGFFDNLGCSFELQLSAGWNMVSFPCLPTNATWDDVLGDCGFYQVLTWDGSGYVIPKEPEFGYGYWVLVLEDCNVTIVGALCENYEVDLPAGWSMIGSITCSVDAGCVFPGYYQLLTWDGTSYIPSNTIEPGIGYWALVLEQTHIVVDETCCKT